MEYITDYRGTLKNLPITSWSLHVLNIAGCPVDRDVFICLGISVSQGYLTIQKHSCRIILKHILPANTGLKKRNFFKARNLQIQISWGLLLGMPTVLEGIYMKCIIQEAAGKPVPMTLLDVLWRSCFWFKDIKRHGPFFVSRRGKNWEGGLNTWASAMSSSQKTAADKNSQSRQRCFRESIKVVNRKEGSWIQMFSTKWGWSRSFLDRKQEVGGERQVLLDSSAVLIWKRDSLFKFHSGLLPQPMGLCNNSVMFSFSHPVSADMKWIHEERAGLTKQKISCRNNEFFSRKYIVFLTNHDFSAEGDVMQDQLHVMKYFCSTQMYFHL